MRCRLKNFEFNFSDVNSSSGSISSQTILVDVFLQLNFEVSTMKDSSKLASFCIRKLLVVGRKRRFIRRTDEISGIFLELKHSDEAAHLFVDK